MIKRGITKAKDILSKSITPFRKELKNVSITLYDQIIKEPNADELAERILLTFSDERGAYKRTYAKRFEDFDGHILSILKDNIDQSTVLSFHDVAVSDGRTAIDFFERLLAYYPNLTYVASDYNPSVFILEKGKLKVTLSHTDKILEIMYPPFVFNTIKRDHYRYYPLNHVMRFMLQHTLVKSLMRLYRSGNLKTKELLLFAPRALDKMKQDKRFILEQHSLLNPFQKQYDVIRAMNVLNPGYFSEEEFFKVLRHIYDGLLDDGLFITGSNQEGGSVVNGGIYQKTHCGFKHIWRSGQGSAIENYMLAINKCI